MFVVSCGSSVGAVLRALAFHQCDPGSIPGSDVLCGLSLLVLYTAARGFSPGTPIFPSHQKPTFDLCWCDFLSPYLVEPLCSTKYIWDINKAIIIIVNLESNELQIKGRNLPLSYNNERLLCGKKWIAGTGRIQYRLNRLLSVGKKFSTLRNKKRREIPSLFYFVSDWLRMQW